MPGIFSCKSAIAARFVQIVLIFFAFCLVNSCGQQTGNSEKGTSDKNSNDENITVTKFDSLAHADSLFRKTEAFYKSEIGDSVIFYAELAKSAYLKIGTKECWRKVIECENFIGVTHRRRGEVDKAKRILKTTYKTANDMFGSASIQMATTCHSLGALYITEFKLDTALFFTEKSLTIRKKLFGKWHIEVMRSLGYLGIIYRRKGDYSKALKYQNESLEISTRLSGLKNIDITTGSAHRNIAVIYENLGKFRLALKHYNKCLEIYRKFYGGQHISVASTLHGMGAIYTRQEDLETALMYYQESLRIHENLPEKVDLHIALVRDNIAAIFMKKGHYENAFDFAKNALNIRRKYWQTENHPDIANSYLSLSNISYKMANYDNAYEFLKKRLTIFETVHGLSHPEVAISYMELANIQTKRNEYQSALNYGSNALKFFLEDSLQDIEKISASYAALANLSFEIGKFQESLQYFQKALVSLNPNFNSMNIFQNPMVPEVVTDSFLFSLFNGKAQALWETRLDIVKAGKNKIQIINNTYNLAISALERLRKGYQSNASKSLLTHSNFNVFENAITAAFFFDHKKRVYNYLERGKSILLLDALKETRAFQFSGIPDSLQNTEYKIRQELNTCQTEIDLALAGVKDIDSQDSKLTELRKQRFKLQEAYHDFLKSIENSYPDYYKLKYNTEVASVNIIQGALNERTTVINYFYGDSTIYIFVLSKNSLEVQKLKRTAQIEKAIQKFRFAVQNSNYVDYIKNGYFLYEKLVSPAKKWIAGQDLVIIPDGPLTYLPFEALLTQPVVAASQDYTKLPYLINEHKVDYNYSATLWLETGRRLRKSEPCYDYVAFAPVFEGSKKKIANYDLLQAKRSLNPMRNTKDVLPTTLDEVKEIENLFTEKYDFFTQIKNFFQGHKTRVFVRGDATENNFKNLNIADFRYVHFATHAFADTLAPKLSGLQLAAEKDTMIFEDGVLRLGEIYNIELNADLAVLSACETGVGKFSRGEGLLGLAQGFMYAGARNLLVSLWQVNSASTTDLMIAFYSNLLDRKQGMRTALHNAKMEMIKKYPEPNKWAPFILIASAGGLNERQGSQLTVK